MNRRNALKGGLAAGISGMVGSHNVSAQRTAASGNHFYELRSVLEAAAVHALCAPDQSPDPLLALRPLAETWLVDESERSSDCEWLADLDEDHPGQAQGQRQREDGRGGNVREGPRAG